MNDKLQKIVNMNGTSKNRKSRPQTSKNLKMNVDISETIIDMNADNSETIKYRALGFQIKIPSPCTQRKFTVALYAAEVCYAKMPRPL